LWDQTTISSENFKVTFIIIVVPSKRGLRHKCWAGHKVLWQGDGIFFFILTAAQHLDFKILPSLAPQKLAQKLLFEPGLPY